ncbi:MAG: hypothetical protein IKS90_07875 [Clostridia bacterium]|nr:hypothetical protein [Clostridia bacterium]
MATELLFYEYPTVEECTAEVLSCTEKDGKYLITLTKTPIFPEGGGQLADGGMIVGPGGNEARITDCRTEDGEIVHYTDAAFPPGARVRVCLDAEKRLDRSEQHTGEHILSGLAAKLFGAKNVGFHMSEEYCTIDLDIPLEREQTEALELAANAAVRADLTVHTEITDGDDASSRPLRKRAEKVQGEVRIVYIDNGKIDSCTCCGTHLNTTGMVGAIRITDHQHYKGGTRLFFVCGGRAARLGIEEHGALTELARRYSTSRRDLPAAIKKQAEEVQDLKSELKLKSALIARTEARELIDHAKLSGKTRVMFKVYQNFGANDLKLILDETAAAMETAPCEWAALIFSSGASGTDYRMGSSGGCKLSMRDLCAAVNAATGGKGGGSPVFAQGRSEKPLDKETADTIENYLIKATQQGF